MIRMHMKLFIAGVVEIVIFNHKVHRVPIAIGITKGTKVKP